MGRDLGTPRPDGASASPKNRGRVPTLMHTDPLAIRCPTCGAPAGVGCHVPLAPDRRREPHKDRLLLLESMLAARQRPVGHANL